MPGLELPPDARPNFSKISRWSSSGIPGPWSDTATTTDPFNWRTSTSTAVPVGEYLTALSIRLPTTWRSRPGSPRTNGTSRTIAFSGTSSWPTAAVAIESRTSEARSTSANRYEKVPASIRDVSSTSPISVASRVDSSPISARNASRCSEESSRQRCCSVRDAPITAAIGLRSSCETSETKSARIIDRRCSSSTVRRSLS